LKVRWTSSIRITALVAISLGLTNFAQAACYPPEGQAPRGWVQDFLNNPQKVLGDNPTGADDLARAIRNLVASDDATLPMVIKLLGSANPQQLAAIGSGLALASRVCLGTGVEADQLFAGTIQSQLAASGIGIAITAFVTEGGQDSPTAATGAGAPGATAFVSGFLQVTGTFPNAGPPPPVIVFPSPSATSISSFTFTGSTTSRSPSRPVSQ